MLRVLLSTSTKVLDPFLLSSAYHNLEICYCIETNCECLIPSQINDNSLTANYDVWSYNTTHYLTTGLLVLILQVLMFWIVDSFLMRKQFPATLPTVSYKRQVESVAVKTQYHRVNGSSSDSEQSDIAPPTNR